LVTSGSSSLLEKKPVDVKPKEDLSKEEKTEVLLDIADQLSKDEKVEIEIPVAEEKEEVMETVVTETKVDQREKHKQELIVLFYLL
jgi:ribosomal protein L17